VLWILSSGSSTRVQCNTCLPFFLISIISILQLIHVLPVINNQLTISTELLPPDPESRCSKKKFCLRLVPSQSKVMPTYQLQMLTQPTEEFVERSCFLQFQLCASKSISCRTMNERKTLMLLALSTSIVDFLD
jgi:hypothetical protein